MPMHVLIAPDSFKESLSAAEVAQAVATGIGRINSGLCETAPAPSAPSRHTMDQCPMADGGEGTVDALTHATDGEARTSRVHGPLSEKVCAQWGILGDGQTAVIEMAEAAGLHLVPTDLRDPTRTTTFGVGQLLAEALDAGLRRVIIGIGGSATNDGGTGMAQALGIRFLTGDGEAIRDAMTGGDLASVRSIDLANRHPALSEAKITVACDVTNPLTGPQGAAAIYGPQKGATPEQIKLLDSGLAHLAAVVAKATNIESLATSPGAGAAGGLGFGLMAFTGAELQRGIEIVLDASEFDRRVQQADLVITGEGKLDGQSISGKTCIGVAQRAQRFGKPTIALVGSADDDAEVCLDHGLTAYHAIRTPGMPLDHAITHAAKLLADLAEKVVRDYTNPSA